MKKNIPVIVLLLCLVATANGADPVSTPSPADTADLQKALAGLIQDALNGKGGWITTLLILIGGLRLLLKPVMNIVGGVVCETKINGYRTTWWFRFLEYTLDLTASVKIARPAPDDASPQATADDAKSPAGKEDPLK